MSNVRAAVLEPTITLAPHSPHYWANHVAILANDDAYIQKLNIQLREYFQAQGKEYKGESRSLRGHKLSVIEFNDDSIAAEALQLADRLHLPRIPLWKGLDNVLKRDAGRVRGVSPDSVVIDDLLVTDYVMLQLDDVAPLANRRQLLGAIGEEAKQAKAAHARVAA